ncbi:coil containing protein [Vibrio phage 1.244.A._10N.261.54.C3]|nr:coil containing protein [Vibrio phage 1.244.A._10N.261.54.C3]AUR98714.1 coil containing protein [Vibrio phage 1.255.O._10N.286.45.F1]
MAFSYLQGKYTVLNPKKYRGDASNVQFRSSWEMAAFKFCDTTPQILGWNSEEIVIPYISPKDGRTHRYFMDLQVWTKNPKTGEVEITLIEIKPEDQTRPPKKGNKKTENYLKEVATWKVNEAKWLATEAYCKARGWHFKKWTEKNLVAGVENDGEIKRKTAEHRAARKKHNSEQAQRNRRIAKMVQGIKSAASSRD